MEHETKRKIENAFYNYNKMREQSEEELDNIRSSGITVDFAKVGHGAGVSNPTEQKAIKCLTQSNALWCTVVERTYIHYKWAIEGVLIKKKFFERKSRREIMRTLCVGESTYHYWLQRVLTTAELWAHEFGLIQ